MVDFWLLSNSQNLATDQALAALPSLAALNLYLQPAPSMTLLVYSDPSKTVYSNPPILGGSL